MKNLKLYIGAGMLATLALTGCQADMDAPGLQVPVATWKANTTIAELKEAMWRDDTNYAILCPEKENGEHYIIKGRVISSDASGNVYKSMYIQDETAAITFSINQNSLYNQYRVGQEILVDVTDLYIGKYAGLEQVGGYGEYNGTPQVSFMIYPKFVEHCQLNGLPDDDVKVINYGDPIPTEGMYCINTTISQLPTDNEGIIKMQSQLVELRNVHFEGAGEETYASYQQTESRNLVDAQGNTIVVRTSGYSNFYTQKLPEGNGTVRALLSYFNGTWQLILRSTADVMFESKGQLDDPYTVDEAIANQNMNVTGWVKGYIVGSVKGGKGTVTSNDDIIWGRDAEMDNNLVIGETADARDFTRCVVVELKAGSDFRKVGNLIDNPGNYGKAIKVRGTFRPQLGMAGVADNNGSSAEFEIEGASAPDTPVTDAPGTLSCDFESGSKIADYTALGWSLANTKGDLSGWYIKTYNNTNYATVSSYLGTANGGPYENWLVTPAIDLSKSEKKVMSFETQGAYYYAGSYMEVYVMTSADPTKATLTKLDAKICTPASSGYSDWVKSGDVDLSSFNGVVYIGFKYYSDKGGQGNGSTYCLDNIVIGKSTSGGGSGSGSGTTPDLQSPVTLSAADATNFKGVHHEEVPAGSSGSANGQAERWQPLEGLTIGDYTFTFTPGTGTNQTAWYNVMSTAASGSPTLRFYTGSTMTINAPAGAKIGKIELKGSNANSSLTVEANVGTATRDGNNVTWTATSGGQSSVTFAFSATYRVLTMDVYLVK